MGGSDSLLLTWRAQIPMSAKRISTTCTACRKSLQAATARARGYRVPIPHEAVTARTKGGNRIYTRLTSYVQLCVCKRLQP